MLHECGLLSTSPRHSSQSWAIVVRAGLVLTSVAVAGPASSEPSRRSDETRPENPSTGVISPIVAALRQLKREAIGPAVEVHSEGVSGSDTYRVRVVAKDHFADVVVDLAKPGSVEVEHEALIERLLHDGLASRLRQALRFSRTLTDAITVAEAETDGTATAAWTELDDDIEPRFVVAVMDDGVARSVIVNGWFGTVLTVSPPDVNMRRRR